MNKPPLPHGLDDLQHGIEVLLGTENGPDREGLAATIVDMVGTIPGTATARLISSVSRFAAWGGNADTVREDFQQFIVETGAWVGAQNVHHRSNINRQMASKAGAAKRTDHAAQQQEDANEWFSKALASFPEAGHVMLLEKSRRLLMEAKTAATNDLNRYMQAGNDFGTNTTKAKLFRLDVQERLLTIRRAKAFLSAQKAR
ncbi:hypothetical protein [Aquabacterium sp. A08]|uniref:hypothetical protein n=1 Tax=Aquabacterium sp. A08 TaxID=2718532 RepID=UPI00141D9BDE|nr:hypothetical protein [Aquabacterium sp. A08]NIC43311.1 hypothetical protein [Aquabacterium sp. A08]